MINWLKSKINLKQDIENLTWILLFSSCLGLLGRFYWFFDLFPHFRVQYVFSACVLGLTGACYKSRQAIGLNGVVLVMNLAFIGAIFMFHTAPVQPIETLDYKVLSSNVLSRNQSYTFVKHDEFYQDLDSVLLSETNFVWVRETAYLKEDFPHYALHPRADNFGMSFYSREEFDGGIEVFRAPDISDFDMPYLWAEFSGDVPFVLVGVHPPPPVDAEITALRDAFLLDIAKRIKAAPDKSSTG